ncbi:hypothetical protein ST47_g653 [Ascochyta rabiei]|uniref:Uncharacterized protein n=1 Tax=Didymella rabiei TaxID=5454 RepID=A0A163LXE8_DIDRA|nr:hypothetical protein ST47_g653 [Ascochyta rabiei]
MGTSKQVGPPTDFPSTHGNSLLKPNGDPASKTRANGDKGERVDVDMKDTIAILEAAFISCDDELKQTREKYTMQKIKREKLENERRIQNDALKKCKEDRDFHAEISNQVLKECTIPYAEQHGISPEKWSRESFEDVMTLLGRDALDAKSLQDQVQGLREERQVLQKEVGALQNDMLAKVKKIQTVNDEAFAQEFRNITSLIKTLSREVRYTSQENIVDILASGTLLTDVSRAHWDRRANRKSLTEAWFWSVLVDNVFRSPFASFGERCDILSAVWQSLFEDQHCNGWPTPTALSETWRHTTMDQMVEKIEQDVDGAKQLKQQYRYLQEDIVEFRNSIIMSLQSGLSKESSTKHSPKIIQLVDKAFALATKMSVQRARLQVTYPKVGENFDEHVMAPLSSVDGDHTENGVVAFIVNPGLTKWGDAHGKNLDHRYDILPSLVQLERQVPKETIDSAYADVVKRKA